MESLRALQNMVDQRVVATVKGTNLSILANPINLQQSRVILHAWRCFAAKMQFVWVHELSLVFVRQGGLDVDYNKQ